MASVVVKTDHYYYSFAQCYAEVASEQLGVYYVQAGATEAYRKQSPRHFIVSYSSWHLF